MPWTETTRPHYEPRCRRYASDLTDAEWALVEPLMPPPSRIGRPRKTDLREVVNALLYMASSGGAWRLAARWRSALRYVGSPRRPPSVIPDPAAAGFRHVYPPEVPPRTPLSPFRPTVRAPVHRPRC